MVFEYPEPVPAQAATSRSCRPASTLIFHVSNFFALTRICCLDVKVMREPYTMVSMTNYT
eukprot:6192483-Pleurochrysis_carterae.AAC.3